MKYTDATGMIDLYEINNGVESRSSLPRGVECKATAASVDATAVNDVHETNDGRS